MATMHVLAESGDDKKEQGPCPGPPLRGRPVIRLPGPRRQKRQPVSSAMLRICRRAQSAWP